MRNFNEIFRKGPSYDNSKSHNKAGLQSVSRKYVFGKTKEEFKLTLSLFRVNAYLMDEISLKLITDFFNICVESVFQNFKFSIDVIFQKKLRVRLIKENVAFFSFM